MAEISIAGQSSFLHHFKGPAADGNGRKILALHCSLAHGGAWQGFATELFKLEPTAEVFAPDLPGHGKALPPDGDVHDIATAMGLALLDQLGGVNDLIGHSFGGTVALRIALEAPRKLRSLTLVEPVLFAAAKGKQGYGEHAAHFAKVALARDSDGWEAAAEAFHGVWGGGIPFHLLPPRQRAYMAERMYLVEAPASVLEEDRCAMLQPGRLERLSLPILLAEGVASPRVIREIHDTFEARLPKVSRLLVGGAAHMLPLTHPKQLAHSFKGLA